MRLGAHISTAGGAYKAFQRAEESTCDSMLIFTKSNRQWRAKPLAVTDIDKFHAAQEQYSHIDPVAVHASYLINIGSPKPEVWEKSYNALLDEVSRAEQLGIPLINFHPGSHLKSGEEAGMDAIVRGLRRLFAETEAYKITVCLENMAGQGTNLGYSFEQLAYLLREVNHERLGVCFDTCHAFAAGYDIRSPEAYAQTMAEFDRTVGLQHIKFFHLNDSKFGLGLRKDRHEHIGQGHIGLEGFANFVNDPRWAEVGAHLETPKEWKKEDGTTVEGMDAVNLATLRSLLRDGDEGARG